MKLFLYTLIFLSGTLCSCSSGRVLSSTIEDDIYYTPGKKSLMVQEVEQLTGRETDLPQPQKNYSGEVITSSGSTKAPVINRQKGIVEQISTADLMAQAQEQLAAQDAGNVTVYSNTGYWIGGFKGSERDLLEAARIINMYPNGFGFFANGQDIALDLSFDPDWNVYTDDNRYWWFPSSTNIELYSSMLFGTYPKYMWTTVWDNPRFDSWAFNSSFNLNFGWGRPGWGFGISLGSGWYDPWGYNGWYGYPYYGGWHNSWWNDPWHHHHYYPHWGNNHWGGGNLPSWGPPSGRPSRPSIGQRPNSGGGITGIRPGNSSRPNGSVTRPSGVTRPNSSLRPDGSITRPNSGVTRPGTVRPGSSSVTRPNSPTVQPNPGVSRPGTVRPGSSSVTRPNSPTVQPNPGVSRPGTVTRPAQSVTRPNPVAPRPSRPNTSSSSSNVKNYTRPQNNYRPTYNNNNNNNSRPSYNSGSVSRPSNSGSSGSSYSPGNSGGSGGGGSRPSSPAPSRPTRR